MNPEVKIKISALDNSQGAFKSVRDSIGKVEKTTTTFRTKVEALQPTFQRIALAGTAAFAAIGAGVFRATQSAAVAEGTWAKFNTVFADGADDMNEFINTIRKEMPTATHVIARMAADLQDLLVPMGLARDESQELTKGFLDVANKVAAFNDVDPAEVLEAFKSGLSGSSEPLRRFGINALDSALELEAMETGLLKAGQKMTDLDPITRNQIKAQALLTLSVKQSADAINGFAENHDSLDRRQKDLQARFQELSVTLGNMFMPILDELVKAMLPIVTRIAEWTEANPELARNIIVAVAALAGLVAVVGTLGLLLPPIIAGFGLIATVIGALSLPVLAIIGLLGVIGYTMYNLWKDWEQHWDNIKWAAEKATDWIKSKTIDPLIEGFEKVMRFIDRIRAGIESIGGKVGKITSGIGSTIGSVFDTVTPFANGGIVTKPTLGLVGEAGPEAIIPLSKAGSLGGGSTFIFNVQGDITDRVKTDIMRDLKRQMRLT